MEKSKNFNKILIISYLIACVVISILCFSLGIGRPIISLLSPLFLLIPVIVEKIFNLKPFYLLNNTLYIYIFFAYCIGTVLDIYKSVPLYDKLMHFLAGVVFTFVGVYLYKLIDKTQMCNRAMFFCFISFFSLTTGYIWEIYEYLHDVLLNENAQRVIETGISDTMQDMIAHLIGTILVLIVLRRRLRNKPFVK